VADELSDSAFEFELESGLELEEGFSAGVVVFGFSGVSHEVKHNAKIRIKARIKLILRFIIISFLV
jgi:hypothetical protein